MMFLAVALQARVERALNQLQQDRGHSAAPRLPAEFFSAQRVVSPPDVVEHNTIFLDQAATEPALASKPLDFDAATSANAVGGNSLSSCGHLRIGASCSGKI